MNLHEIKAFIDAMATSDLAEMEATQDGWTLRLARQTRNTPSASTPSQASPVTRAQPTHRATEGVRRSRALAKSPEGEIRAPLAGIVHLQPAPDQPAFVTVGASVEAGATVCVIEAMKMFNPVSAPQAGLVTAILVTSGAEVDAGQPLVRIG